MNITFSPQLGLAPFTLAVFGDAIEIDGARYDFSPLPEGAILPRAAVGCAQLASDVIREDGAICLTLVLPCPEDAPEAVRFPDPITITEDGPVLLPGSKE